MAQNKQFTFELPTVLGNFGEALNGYLHDTEKLPIHDFRLVQQHWTRTLDVTELLNYDTAPNSTTLRAERNRITGEVIDFVEIPVENCGLNAKNSTSLNRAPGPPTEFLRGASSNYPFWPGGFPDPVLNLPDDEAVDFERIDLGHDLLKIPAELANIYGTDYSPFDEKKEEEAEGEIEGDTDLITLIDAIEKQQNELGLWSDEIPAKKTDEPDVSIQNLSIDEPKVLNITETKTNEPVRKSQWAEMIDLSVPVKDFHKRVPDMAIKYDFELDSFQKQAIILLEQHCNVFVAAPTSAGKTIVAEYAIALSERHMTRTVYTSPIKALSNQKYRDFKTIFKDVGLITGDFQINQTASCLIMTTEILRTMLLCGSDVTRDLEYVVFDEVHYISDADRGHVWEEVLILLPSHVTIVMLSATVPNTLEFAHWVGLTKQRKVYVLSTIKRPVPLMHYLYTGCGGKSKNDKFLILNETNVFIDIGVQNAFKSLNERESKKENKGPGKGAAQKRFAPKSTQSSNQGAAQDKTMWSGLIDHLKREDLLPVVAFTLSRKRCDVNAESMTSVDLNTAREKSCVHRFFRKCIQKLKEPDQNLPQIVKMQYCLERGIGIHHSGILPILKEIVEMLFHDGLIKILFATETFAMGVNMPARTVIFDSVQKYDGQEYRNLLPAEYIQMAGRAGRRGHDKAGTVLIICRNSSFDTSGLRTMMLGKPKQLVSQFRLTYGILLNLLRVQSFPIESMISHSFREIGHRDRASKLEFELVEVEKKLKALPEKLPEHLEFLADYYLTVWEFLTKWNVTWTDVIQNWAAKEMTIGRLVIINHDEHYFKLGLILHVNSRTKKYTYTVLVLDHQQFSESNLNSTIDKNKSEKNDDWHKMVSFTKTDHLFQPDGVGGHQVLKMPAVGIYAILNKAMKVEGDRIIRDWDKRQLPRFQDDPPDVICAKAVQELTKITKDLSIEPVPLYPTKGSIGPINLINVRVDFKVNDLNLIRDLDELDMLRERVDQFKERVNIANFEETFADVYMKKSLEYQLLNLKAMMSPQSMSLYTEWQNKKKVLEELGYIDHDSQVLLKGRVACEMGSSELLITELVLRNSLTNLKAEEVAALLSSLVFEARTNSSTLKVNSNLEQAMKDIIKINEDITRVERKYLYGDEMCDVTSKLNFGLIEVVNEWALQKPFVDIMNLTDIQEGIIVRCIVQLNETIRDVKNAARLIGEPVLYAKMEDASNCIKRDIVFAASLYTQNDIVSTSD